MGASWRVAGLVALLAGIAGSAWLVSRASDPAAARGDSVSRAAGEERPTAIIEPLELDAEEERSRIGTPTEVDRRAFAGAGDGALWVRGRVIVPGGAPADEAILVSASSGGFPAGDPRSLPVAVAADGSFRLAFVAGERRGRISLAAQYAWLPEPVSVDLLQLPEELVLEPLLGARLDVHVAFSDGVLAERLDDLRVGVRTSTSWLDESRTPTRREGGVFVLGGIDTKTSSIVRVRSDEWVDVEVEVAPLGPGESRRVDVLMRPGATVSGHVLDEAGHPVPDFSIEANTEESRIPLGGSGAVTGEDGGFELRGVPPGRVILSAFEDGFQPLSHVVGDLAGGDRVSGLAVTIRRNPSLEGRLSWHDGRAAASGSVTARPRYGNVFSAGHAAEVEADGSFEIAGLEPGAYDLLASTSFELGGGRVVPAWAFLDEVSVPGPPVELVLCEGAKVRGRVVDDRGQSVERFEIQVHRADGGSLHVERSWISYGNFRTEDGRFELPRVPHGRWSFTARPKDRRLVEGESEVVPVPQVGEIVLVCAARALIGGVVLDARGAPVRRARVTAETPGGRSSSDSTDQEGRFEIRVDPGSCRVSASCEGWSPSRAESVEVGAGEERLDLVLTLTESAGIRVRLAPALGETAQRTVSLRSLDDDRTFTEAETDDAGCCRFDGLSPGQFVVILEPMEPVETDEDPLALAHFGAPVHRRVELGPGDSLEVLLGGAESDGVRVHGVVSEGEQPLARAKLSFLIESVGIRAAVESDERGRFELYLEGGTSYVVLIGDSLDGAVFRIVDVPRGVASFFLELRLPSATLAGLVVDPQGVPVQDAMVILEAREMSDLVGFRVAHTNDSGRFRFANVEAGRCWMVAMPFTEFSGGATAAGFSRRISLDVEEGASRADIELRLSTAVSVRGRVPGAGRGAHRQVLVEILDEDLRPAFPWLDARCDDLGRFTIPGMAPGRYRLRAIDPERELTGVPVEVELREGETCEVELPWSG